MYAYKYKYVYMYIQWSLGYETCVLQGIVGLSNLSDYRALSKTRFYERVACNVTNCRFNDINTYYVCIYSVV